jgi:hypothetical protein
VGVTSRWEEVTLVFDFGWFAGLLAAIIRLLVQDMGGTNSW